LLKRIVCFLSGSSTARKTGRPAAGDAAFNRRRRIGQENVYRHSRRGSLEAVSPDFRMALFHGGYCVLSRRPLAFRGFAFFTTRRHAKDSE